MTDADPRKPAPTIYDVARVAGVAPSTVSRAFARPGRVNAVTAARIHEVAKDLGYRANLLGRALSTSQSHMIAVMVSDVANPFYSEIIAGAQAGASEAGYVILLADAQESGVREREALERLVPVVEGIVVASSRMSDAALRTIAKQAPMIVLNRELSDVPSVVTDNPLGMRRAAEHLAALGHEAITYVAGPEASWADGIRWQSLREAGHKLDLHTRRIGPYPPTFAGGLRAATDLVAHPTSAVIAYNDLMALGVVRGVAPAGLSVPQDLSVIGFDDILMSRLFRPSLTTVAAPLRTMGAMAVRSLLAIVSGSRPHTGHSPVHTGRSLAVPVRLVIRGSTAQRSRKSTSPALGTTNVSGSAS